MPSNIELNAGSAGSLLVTKRRSHDGDTSQQQGIFLSGVSGSEDAYTFVDIAAGDGTEANALRVTIASDSSPLAITNTALTDLAAAINGGELDVNIATDTVGIGGTEYNVDDVVPGIPVGPTFLIERDDVIAPLPEADGDWVNPRATAEGALWVQDFNSDAILADTTAILADTANIDTNITTIAGAVAAGQMQVDVIAVTADLALGTDISDVFGTTTLIDTVVGDNDSTAQDRLYATAALQIYNGSTLDLVREGTTAGSIMVSIQDDQVGIGGGTQYTLGTDTFLEGTSIGRIAGVVRVDSPGTLVDTNNEITALQVDSAGALRVTGGGGGTEYVEDAVAPGNPTGTNAMLVREDSPISISADGDWVGQRGTEYGASYVQIVTSTGTFVDSFAGPTEYTEDAIAPADPTGSTFMMTRDDVLGTLGEIEGDWTRARATAEGALWVQDFNSDAILSDTTAILADTASMDTNLGTIAGAVATGQMQVDIVADGAGLALAANQLADGHNVTVDNTTGAPANVQIGDGTLQATVRDTGANDSLNVAIVDASGNQIVSFGGGTEYVVNAAAPADPTGSTFVMERDDVLATLTEIEGDWTNPRATAEGALWVQDFNSDAILADTTAILADTASIDTNMATVAGAIAAGQMQVDIVADGAGLALASNQLADNHNVTVSNASLAITAAALPLPAGAATAANQLVDGHNVTVDNAAGSPVPVEIGDGTNTAAIHNLAANDALSVAIVDGSGTQITSFGGGTEYTVNVAAPADPVGSTFVMERDDVLSALTEIAGDWTNPRATAEGALWVQDFNSDAILSDTTAILADTAIISGAVAAGQMQVDIVADGAGLATAANQLPDGHNVTVDNASIAITAAALPLPSGAATSANQLANGHDVAITGAALTALQLIDNPVFVDDAAFTLTSSSVMMAGAMVDASLSALAAADGDAVPFRVDANGALHVTGGGGGTEYTEDAVAAGDPIGGALIMVRDDTPVSIAADGDNVALRATEYGAAYVQIVSSAGAFIDSFAGPTEYTQDAVHADPATAATWLMPRDDALTTQETADGDWTLPRANARGAQWVEIDPTNALDVSAATVTVDLGANNDVVGALTHNNAAPTTTNFGALTALANAADPTYTEGNQVLLSTDLSGALRITGAAAGTEYTEDAVAPADPAGGALLMVRDDTPVSIAADADMVAARSTQYGAQYVQIVSSTGSFVDSFGGGTEYTVNAAAPADPVGSTFVMERDDEITALTEIEGDWTNPRATAEGALWVQDFNSDAILADTTAILADTANMDTNLGTLAGAVTGSEMQVDIVAVTPDLALGTDISNVFGTASLILAAQADNVVNTSDGLQTTSFGYMFDGTTWDRVRGDATDGLLVNLGTNNDVTVAGVATAANQLPDGHNVTVDNAAGAGAVNIQDGGNSITIDATSLPLPTGAATAANQLADNHQVTISNASLTVDSELPAAAALGDNTANPTVPGVGSFAMLWDGANWDRAPGNQTDGLLVNLGGNNDVTVAGVATAANQLPDGHNVTVDNIAGNAVFIQPGTGVNLDTSNVTIGAALPTGANTIGDVTVSGAALTALQLIDNSIFVDDAPFTLTTSSVNMAGAIVDASLSALAAAEGDAVPLRVNSTGALHVTGGGGGTEYTEDVVAAADPVGTALNLIRDDLLQADLVSADGDNVAARGSAYGAQYVAPGNFVSTNNSSTATLGISGNFTGTGDDCAGFTSVTVMVDSSHDSATDGMTFEFSSDNTNWDIVYTFTYTAANGGRHFQLPVSARYFRVNYTNGGTGQTTFRVQSILHANNVLTSMHRLVDTVHPDRSAQIVKAAIVAQASGAGNFVPVAANASGRLQVAADVTGVETPADGDATPTDAVPVQAFNSVYNGATWDLMREGSIAGSLLVDLAGTTVPLPTGAATAANQLADNHQVTISNASLTVDLGANNDVVGALTHNNAAPAATNLGALTALANAASPTYTEGNQVLLSTDLSGALRITGAAAGTEYTEGATDASITGGVAMMEVAADTIEPIQGSVADGLLVNLGSNNDVTVAGVATAANQLPDGHNVTVDNLTGNAVFIQPGTGVNLDTNAVTITGFPDNEPFNVAQMNGVAVTMGNGASGTGVQRVTLASDSTGIVGVDGQNTHDGTTLGNPVLGGARATNSVEGVTQVANADLTHLQADLNGVLLTRNGTTLEELISERISDSTGTSTNFTTFNAGGAGVHNYITSVTITNTHASTNGYVDLRDGSAGSIIWSFPAPATGGATHNFDPPLKGAANTALAYDVSAAIANVLISINGYQAQG